MLSVSASAQNVLREYWLNIPGTSLSSLAADARFPSQPDGTSFPQNFEAPVNWEDNYGTRMRAYVVAPATGSYTFWVAGDDESVLYLSEDESPSNAIAIASVPGWSNSRQYDADPQQQSDPVNLVAGRRYYIEARQKEGGGGDNLSAAWQIPGIGFDGPISGDYLEPFQIINEPPTFTNHPSSLSVFEGVSVEFSVSVTGAEPIDYTWYRDGELLTGERDSRLILASVTVADDGAVFHCIATNSLGSAQSQDAVLTVGSETTAPTVSILTPPGGATVASLLMIEVFFSEPVVGVDAEDLLVDGTPAIEVSGFGAGPYLFEVSAPAEGDVEIAWAASHGIVDGAGVPNAFAGGSWTVSIDPRATLAAVVISEILADNGTGLVDEFGDRSDWIELWNQENVSVDLSGWSLTDDEDRPGKWVIPAGTIIAPNGRRLIYASGRSGEDAAGSNLNANFKLSASGEYLGLFSPELPRRLVDEIAGGFPEQRSDHSYIRQSDGSWAYTSNPTPLAANAVSDVLGVLSPPHFTVTRGFFENPIDVALTTREPDAVIRYTTDGSTPTASNGQAYSTPLHFEDITLLRAGVFKTGFLPSRIGTHTYLIDISAGIAKLPVLSIVTDDSNLWGTTGIMEVSPRNTNKRGIAWERPTSAEWILSDNSGFQIDAGIRVQGGGYVRDRYDPNGSLPFSKYSFRLYFRGDYGAGSLAYPLFPKTSVDEFEVVSLRAGMNDHTNPFIIDELVRRLSKDMGLVASTGTLCNLLLNGVYQGYYNPTERIDGDFLNSYLGSEYEWDIRAQFGEDREGDGAEWSRLENAIYSGNMQNPADYARVEQLLDIDRFIDYILLNIYTDTGDWPHNNWRAARQRRPGAKWFFLVWDAEWALGSNNSGVSDNSITTNLAHDSAEIARFFRALQQNPDFQLRFADRFHKHCLNGGALSEENVLERFNELWFELRQLNRTISGSVRSSWVPNRMAPMTTHLRQANLYASDFAPVFSQHGGTVQPGFELGMQTTGGTIYYTLDGSDPMGETAAGFEVDTLFAEDAPKRVLVPVNGGLGDNWTGADAGFNDSGWTLTTGGIGYDRNGDYDSLFTLDLGPQMDGINGSAYMRIPFTTDQTSIDAFVELTLRVRYDDGFIAYLNGVPVASANPPASPSWNSTASAGHSDSEAMTPISFDLTDYIANLVPGENLLAIHGLNTSTGSSDFLISASLDGLIELEPDQEEPRSVTYSGPIPVDGSMTVKARTFDGTAWSALSEADFQVGVLGVPVRISEIMYHATGGDLYEFVELTNLSGSEVALDGMYFDGIDLAFGVGKVLGPHESAIVISNDDPSAFALRYPGVGWIGEYGGSLSNGGERISLFTREGALVTSVSYGDSAAWPSQPDGDGWSLELVALQADPNTPASWVASAAPGGSPGVFAAVMAGTPIRINELVAASEEGDVDWIELHNPGASPVDLGGWMLTDDPGDAGKFVFPVGTSIEAGGFLVVICDTDLAVPGLRAGFALSQQGETVVLSDGTGERVDVVEFGSQITGWTLARVNDAWVLGEATQGGANVAATVADPSVLVFNEWLTQPLFGEDAWVELFNSSQDLPVALSGIHIAQDDQLHQLRELSFIEPSGFLVLRGDGGFSAGHVGFFFKSGLGTLELFGALGESIATLDYFSAGAGVSQGLFPDGTGDVTPFPGSTTPGSANTQIMYSGPSIVEIMAWNDGAIVDSQGGSHGWIEVHNDGADAFDLGGFGIGIGGGGAPDWTFPIGTMIGPDERIVVWFDPSRPESLASETDLNAGFDLPVQSENVRLFDAFGFVVQEMNYGFQLRGRSIGALGDAWRLMSEPTPGAPNAVDDTGGSTQDLRINEWLASGDGVDDFIEIYNAGDRPVAMDGLVITDDLSENGAAKYLVGPATFVPAGGWVRWLADGETEKGSHHLPFGLNADGEVIRLATQSQVVLDEVVFGLQVTGQSQGRLPDGGSLVDALYPTPGAANSVDAPAGPVEIIAISGGQGSVTFSFTAAAGVEYVVERAASLTSPVWSEFQRIPPAAASEVAEVMDSGLDGVAEAYYRIIAQ